MNVYFIIVKKDIICEIFVGWFIVLIFVPWELNLQLHKCQICVLLPNYIVSPAFAGLTI